MDTVATADNSVVGTNDRSDLASDDGGSDADADNGGGGGVDLDQEKEKPCSWARIGAAIGRTGPQCRMRYHLSLDPRLKWRLWTDVEDDQLLGLRARGYNWAMVSNSCVFVSLIMDSH